jgi:hypothetical protein
MDIPITLGCYKCGSGEISIPSKSKNAIVTCNSCHANLGKWGDIKAAALSELTKIVKEISMTNSLARPKTHTRATNNYPTTKSYTLLTNSPKP